MEAGSVMNNIKIEYKLIAILVSLILATSFITKNLTYAEGNKNVANPMQLEILEIPSTGPAIIDITTVVKKYVFVGMSSDEAIKVLKIAGFEVFDVSNNRTLKKEERMFLAIWKFKKATLSHYEARVSIKESNSKITHISAQRTYQSI